jgi:hypothetical protein
MGRAFVALVAATLMTVMPARADAWGFAGHKLIMRQAIELLPPELRPFFERFKEEVVIRSTDPDLWRNAGWDDSPNHFLDFGVREYGAYPFTALPRDIGAAIEKFGMPTVKRNGMLPWRFAEEYGQLRRAFEGFRRSAAYTTSDTMFFAAIAAHYIQDAHQPFHATDNYDGRTSGNSGIHARFERDLIERFESRLRLSPAAPVAMTKPRDLAFDTLLASHQLVAAILKADTDAAAGKQVYDDAYFEAFFVKVQPILERRLSAAISSTAGLIIGAWQEAGRPALRLTDARPPRRVPARR